MRSKKQTCLITGAAGFIGSHLCQALLDTANTIHVVGIDNLNNYYDPTIKKRRIKKLELNNRFTFYKISILDQKKILALIKTYRPTILIHLAAEVGVRNGEIHPLQYFTTNVIGTQSLLESATSYVEHAIIFSSSSVYGSTKNIPFRETEALNTTIPLSAYGASKLAMEITVQNYYKRTSIPISIVRPFSIYGPDGRPDMLPIKLLIAAKNNISLDIYAPTQYFRDWTYIDTCIESVLAIINNPNKIQIVNIGNGHPMSLFETIEISQKIVQTFGHTFTYIIKPANHNEMIRTSADTTKLKTIIKLKKNTSFQEGFTKTAEFFFSHPDLYIK